MQNAQKFWDGTAEKYAAKPIKNMPAYEQTLDRTRHYLSMDDTVLEVGCGTGTTALILSKDVKHVTASDISAKMIEIGKGKAADQDVGNVDFVQATLKDEALGPGPYDAVLAFNILHLLEDLPGSVARANSLLKPGGMFISKTVCLGEQSSFWRVAIFVMQKLGLAPYVNFVTFAELEQTVEDAGFKIVETGEYPATPPKNRFIVARKL